MKTVNHECYVSLEVAKLLKQAGFDWDVNSYYNHILYIPNEWVWEVQTRKPTGDLEGCPRPTLSIAQKWLREVKNFHIFVEYDNNIYQCRIDQMEHIYYVKHREWLYNNAFNEFSTYEEAQEAGIKKALELILEKGE